MRQLEIPLILKKLSGDFFLPFDHLSKNKIERKKERWEEFENKCEHRIATSQIKR